VWISHWI
jgi:hypothetical protein